MGQDETITPKGDMRPPGEYQAVSGCAYERFYEATCAASRINLRSTQNARLRGAERKQVPHTQDVIAPGAGKTDAAPDRRIILLGIRRGGVEHEEAHHAMASQSATVQPPTIAATGGQFSTFAYHHGVLAPFSPCGTPRPAVPASLSGHICGCPRHGVSGGTSSTKAPGLSFVPMTQWRIWMDAPQAQRAKHGSQTGSGSGDMGHPPFF